MSVHIHSKRSGTRHCTQTSHDFLVGGGGVGGIDAVIWGTLNLCYFMLKAKLVWFIFPQTFHLISMRFGTELEQSNQKILVPLWNEKLAIKGNQWCFTDSVKKNIWLALRHLWTNFIQLWHDDSHLGNLQFNINVRDPDVLLLLLLHSPAISLGFTIFGWDFCVCDRLIQPLR